MAPFTRSPTAWDRGVRAGFWERVSCEMRPGTLGPSFPAGTRERLGLHPAPKPRRSCARLPTQPRAWDGPAAPPTLGRALLGGEEGGRGLLKQILQEPGLGPGERVGLRNRRRSAKVCLERESESGPHLQLGVAQDPDRISFGGGGRMGRRVFLFFVLLFFFFWLLLFVSQGLRDQTTSVSDSLCPRGWLRCGGPADKSAAVEPRVLSRACFSADPPRAEARNGPAAAR